LPTTNGVLAVCAHPDDESFGLGGIVAALTEAGIPVSVLCFTRGEASTLHAGPGALAAVRSRELAAAAAALDVRRTELLTYADGRLGGEPLEELAGHVHRLAGTVGADTLLVFDLGGITGHPDHQRATEAALAAAAENGYAVLAWALPTDVGRALNAEFETAFVGRADAEIDIVLPVDRNRQLAAISHHTSQSTDNPVLWRRLELQGDVERLRWLQPETLESSRSDTQKERTYCR
jgi:LmbE family N-acetylglucosaminyl deacetylase